MWRNTQDLDSIIPHTVETVDTEEVAVVACACTNYLVKAETVRKPTGNKIKKGQG